MPQAWRPEMKSSRTARNRPAGWALAVKLCMLPSALLTATCPDSAAASLQRQEVAALGGGRQTHWCGMESMERIRAERDGTKDRADSRALFCPPLSDCDLRSVRDATAIFPLTIPVIVHVMRDEDGSGGILHQTVDKTIGVMNADFAHP